MDARAIEAFLRMIEDGKDSAMLRYGLGTAYLHQENFVQAVEHLGKAVELDPQYSAAWKHYGKALTADGQKHPAMHAYERGIDVAESRGDKQAVKEMRVFLKRLKKN